MTNSAALMLVEHSGGLVVSGPSGAVDHLVADLVRLGGEGVVRSGGQPIADLADLGGLAASVVAVATSSCEYVRHTSRGLELLREHGAIPAPGEPGAFRSFVLGPQGFAGNLDWSVVRLGPERALALQTLAVGMALRTAIKQVEAAVERVEGKVDRIAKLVRAERLGTAIGNHRTLTALAQRVRVEGAISATDWSSVATLGPAVVEDIEALRAYIRSELADAKGGWRTRGRAEDANELLDQDLVVESVSLLLVAEHNLSLWQDVRVANVRQREPQHLPSVVEDVWATLRVHQDQDQDLLKELIGVVTALTTPSRHDGLAPLQSQRLAVVSQRLDDLASWFADQRTLDHVATARQPRPGFTDSLGYLVGRAGGTATTLRDRIRRRNDGVDEPPTVTSSSSPDHKSG